VKPADICRWFEPELGNVLEGCGAAISVSVFRFVGRLEESARQVASAMDNALDEKPSVVEPVENQVSVIRRLHAPGTNPS
jgi:hypothetical protein